MDCATVAGKVVEWAVRWDSEMELWSDGKSDRLMADEMGAQKACSWERLSAVWTASRLAAMMASAMEISWAGTTAAMMVASKEQSLVV